MGIRKKYNLINDQHLFLINQKTIQRERVLINLLQLLKFDGVNQSRADLSEDEVYSIMWKHNEIFVGFSEQKELVKKWVRDNYMAVIYQGLSNEQYASLLPLSLNAYKTSVKKYIKDFNAARQVWQMLLSADTCRRDDNKPSILFKLKDYLSQGYDKLRDQVEDNDHLDLPSWLVAAITNQLPNDSLKQDDHHGNPEINVLCPGQARILADDLERMLTYSKLISSTPMLETLTQIMSLHLGFYVLRLAQMLPYMAEKLEQHPCCKDCKVGKGSEEGQENCPFPLYFQIDIKQGYTGAIFKLSSLSIDMHDRQLTNLIESMFFFKNHIDFMKQHGGLLDRSFELPDTFRTLSKEENELRKIFYRKRLEELLEANNEELAYDVEDYEKYYIEFLTHRYSNEHLLFFRKLLSALFAKNEESGIMQQGGPFKKYYLGMNVLDTFIHLAMLERKSDGKYATKTLRIDQLLDWLQKRYGFYINNTLPQLLDSDILFFLRDNQKYFSRKLKEIGYYQATSDAYNTQWLLPRYRVSQGEEV